MRNSTILTAFLVFGFILANAQYNTGDTQLNASLVQIDAQASVNFSAFKSDISLNYNVPEKKINSWSVELGMKAGDIYLALEIAKILKKPADDVVKVYRTNKQKGWGAIAKELGIKPGSPEFHALKGSADKHASKGKNKENGKGEGKGKEKENGGAKPKGKKN